MHIINNSDGSNSTIYLTHSPLSHLVPLSNTQVYGIGFDRHIYLYEEKDNEWKFAKSITKETSSTPAQSTSNVVADSVSGSIQDRLRQFQGGFQKKQSLIVTTSVQKNIHSANINSVNVFADKFLVTSDYAGFVKVWNI